MSDGLRAGMAGGYILRYEPDFGGALSGDAQATVGAGLSGVEMKIPSYTAARILAETTEAGTAGNEPLLTVRAGVRLGSLRLGAT